MVETQPTDQKHNLDEDGFLKTMASWNRAIAQELANEHGIGELSEDHWRVIEFVKDYYKANNTGPPVIRISKATGLSRSKICDLFPCGVAKGAYRLAGLPRPPGCAW